MGEEQRADGDREVTAGTGDGGPHVAFPLAVRIAVLEQLHSAARTGGADDAEWPSGCGDNRRGNVSIGATRQVDTLLSIGVDAVLADSLSSRTILLFSLGTT